MPKDMRKGTNLMYHTVSFNDDIIKESDVNQFRDSKIDFFFILDIILDDLEVIWASYFPPFSP